MRGLLSVTTVDTTVLPNNELTAQQIKLTETTKLNKHHDTKLSGLSHFYNTLGTALVISYCYVRRAT